MDKIFIILSFLTIILIGCGQGVTKKQDKIENAESIVTMESVEAHIQIDDEYLIKENGVDIFWIGKQIPFNAKNYTIEKEMVYFEEAIEEPIYKVLENSRETFIIRPEYDYEKELFTDKIGRITILSEKFKTAEGIGIGATLEEFKSKYPDFNRIYFSYIGWNFWVETNQYKLSFKLDEKDYVGEKIQFDSDMTILELSDFKKDAKIVAIII